MSGGAVANKGWSLLARTGDFRPVNSEEVFLVSMGTRTPFLADLRALPRFQRGRRCTERAVLASMTLRAGAHEPRHLGDVARIDPVHRLFSTGGNVDSIVFDDVLPRRRLKILGEEAGGRFV